MILPMTGMGIWGVALAIGLAVGGAMADTWPDRPVHIVVPLTAGSATDVWRASWRNVSRLLPMPSARRRLSLMSGTQTFTGQKK